MRGPRAVAIVGMLAWAGAACGNDGLTGPHLAVEGHYDVTVTSTGGSCGFQPDPISASVEVARDGTRLDATLTAQGQSFVYGGTLASDGEFHLELVDAMPPLGYSASSTVNGGFESDGLMAVETFEIADHPVVADCTDVSEWNGVRS